MLRISGLGRFPLRLGLLTEGCSARAVVASPSPPARSASANAARWLRPETVASAGGSSTERGGLEEAADRVAVDAELDDAARAVDLVDRVGRDEAPAPGEKARLDR